MHTKNECSYPIVLQSYALIWIKLESSDQRRLKIKYLKNCNFEEPKYELYFAWIWVGAGMGQACY